MGHTWFWSDWVTGFAPLAVGREEGSGFPPGTKLTKVRSWAVTVDAALEASSLGGAGASVMSGSVSWR